MKKPFPYLSINGLQSRNDIEKLEQEFQIKTSKLEQESTVLRSILLSLMDRNKLEQIIERSLAQQNKPQINLSKLGDKKLFDICKNNARILNIFFSFFTLYRGRHRLHKLAF